MAIDLGALVGDLVTERPARAALLDDLGIDYCCGGQRTLAEACHADGLDPVVIAAALDDLDEHTRSAATPGWVHLEPADLCDHIALHHHTYVRDVLPKVVRLARAVPDHDGAPSGDEVCALVEALATELEQHLAYEEAVVFPAIREGRLDPVMAGELDRHGHEGVGTLLARLAAATDGFTADDGTSEPLAALCEALAELADDLELHVHKENNVLFPAARRRATSAAG